MSHSIGGLSDAVKKAFSDTRDSIFGTQEVAQPPAAETFAPIPLMPVASADDSAMQAAKKKSIADQIARRGRASTILTNDSTEKLGG